MKEVDLIPDDPKSAECVKQLEQVLVRVFIRLGHSCCYMLFLVEGRFKI